MPNSRTEPIQLTYEVEHTRSGTYARGVEHTRGGTCKGTHKEWNTYGVEHTNSIA